MANTSVKDPYAFNGAPLSTERQASSASILPEDVVPPKKKNRHFYIESYGCQMNFSDSEIVAAILDKEGYQLTENLEEANLVLVNTCSIREKAEQTVRKRLELFNGIKNKKMTLK